MKRAVSALAVLSTLGMLALGTVALDPPSADAAGGTSANLPGASCPAFPADNVWHADVSGLPVHRRNAQWKSHMESWRDLHPDFGPSFGEQPVPYGIPLTYVNSSHPKVAVDFLYSDESDHVRYPLGDDTKIEGGRAADGDRHAIIVDRGTCRLYETWDTHQRAGGSWYAGSGATWSLTSNALRPATWTSADAAGLPILPGLLRYEETVRGTIDHAIRFTTPVTDQRFIWPARHQAGAVSDRSYPPMGARFRLKASYPISSGLRYDTRNVLRAMQTYGLILADNGAAWFFQGTQDTRWPNAMLDELKRVPASAFEAVDESALMVSSGSGRVR